MVEIVLYEAPDGQVRLGVRLERETVGLSQSQMTELFGRERSVITSHVNNVFGQAHIDEGKQCAESAHCFSGQSGMNVFKEMADCFDKRQPRLRVHKPDWIPLLDVQRFGSRPSCDGGTA